MVAGFACESNIAYDEVMKLGFIGLGKMGGGMVEHLGEQGHEVVAWNRSEHPLKNVETVEELVRKLETPRIVWLMLPNGEVIDEFLGKLVGQLNEGDLIIDGGNSFYKDSIRRGEKLRQVGIGFMDVGVSGGPGGARNGACLMIGGEKNDYVRLEWLWQALAAPKAYAYLGKAGAGHFAKMIHNGIEYGMMEAIAEGAATLRFADFGYRLAEVFRIYNQKSVIESRLVGWAEEAFREDKDLREIAAKIDHTGEGEWTVKTAEELGVEVPVIKKSFEVRVKSGQDDPQSADGFRNKVVSALRGKFGGHPVKTVSSPSHYNHSR